ncbi:hypothetical protein QFZ94_008220 [Paraburkholderia sp. JPY465]
MIFLYGRLIEMGDQVKRMPAKLVQPCDICLGLDCDNDCAFMNPAVFDFKATGIEMVRWRACKKNDQARVAQKNGAVCTSSGGGRQATRSRSHRKHLPHFIKCRGCISTSSNRHSN